MKKGEFRERKISNKTSHHQTTTQISNTFSKTDTTLPRSYDRNLANQILPKLAANMEILKIEETKKYQARLIFATLKFVLQKSS